MEPRSMKKKSRMAGILVATALIVATAACVSQKTGTGAPVAAQQVAPAAVAAPPANTGWSIQLKGIRDQLLWESFYNEAKTHASHYVKKTVDKKGVATVYEGMPLRLIIAMIDGKDAEHAWNFDKELWAAGYDVTLTASDGYSATFNTKDLAADALILADRENGTPIKAMIVGDSPKNLWVKDLAAITTSLSPNLLSKAAADFSLELSINGAQAVFSLKELEKLPIYMESRGAYTTSAGTRYEGVYGGVRLHDLVKTYAEISPTDSITFVAMDGYEMTYPGSRILDKSEGDWLLAFKLDGDYLPKDPGYLRTILVGPKTPNIDGHLSVRMVKKIVVKQKDFADFTLSMMGKMNASLDRSTIQSCVSCHRKSVTFERKGISAEYTGVPLWLLMGYVDDLKYAPHKQDTAIKTYDDAAAAAGYTIAIKAADGYTVSLDSKFVNRNSNLIVAMYKNGEKLPPEEAPLVLVWDKSMAGVPETLKNVKMISSVAASF